LTEPASTLEDPDSGAASASTDIGSANFRQETLLKEYQHYRNAVDRRFDLILRTASVGFTTAGGLIYLISSNNVLLRDWSIGLAPMLLVLFYSMIILFIYEIIYMYFYIADLEKSVSEESRIPFLHFEHNIARGLSSFRTGSVSYLFSYLMIVLFAVVLYAVLVAGIFSETRGRTMWRPRTRLS
jgi:tellurite resistance protein TehA-like permease